MGFIRLNAAGTIEPPVIRRMVFVNYMRVALGVRVFV